MVAGVLDWQPGATRIALIMSVCYCLVSRFMNWKSDLHFVKTSKQTKLQACCNSNVDIFGQQNTIDSNTFPFIKQTPALLSA